MSFVCVLFKMPHYIQMKKFSTKADSKSLPNSRRGITPPHRIKSISMSSFNNEEVNFLKSRGNIWCSKVWMGLYDKSRSTESKDEDALKYHIIQKYEKKAYYVDPSQIQQSLTNINQVEVLQQSSQQNQGGFIGTTLTQRSANSSQSSTSNFVSRPNPIAAVS